jgi:hypothetical protein
MIPSPVPINTMEVHQWLAAVEGLPQAVEDPYGPEMNLSSASHYRGGRCSVGLPTVGPHWEANDFFHLLSGLGDRARRVTDDTKSGTRGLEKFLAPIYCAIAAGWCRPKPQHSCSSPLPVTRGNVVGRSKPSACQANSEVQDAQQSVRVI